MRLLPTRATAVALGTVVAVALTGCAEGDAVQQQAVSGEDGIQATGRIDGKRVAITTGQPEVVYGDCDPGDGLDTDLCIVARTIDGVTFNLVIENPESMVEGEAQTVARHGCVEVACDDVTDALVIDLRVDGEQSRATAGTVTTTAAGERSSAQFNLRFASGDTLVGSFDVSTPNR